MSEQPESRVCRRGHRVSAEDGTGQIKRSANGRLILVCMTCRAAYNADLKRLGMARGGWGK